jgi:S1-C subfamily serine protease
MELYRANSTNRTSSTNRINSTVWVVNIIATVAVSVFTLYVLRQILVPNVSNIAKTVTVKIDGANTGSGVIVEHREDRYTVLSNWHVVSPTGKSIPTQSATTIQTFDGRKYLIPISKIKQITGLDLATLEFQSKSRYPVVTIGNSDRLSEGKALYISGWADPSPQLADRAYQLLVGSLSGRIPKPRDGYTLVYTINALPGMSGGPVLDRRGNLVGIHGRAIVDLRTGIVSSVLGIDINRYLQAIGDFPRKGWLEDPANNRR